MAHSEWSQGLIRFFVAKLPRITRLDTGLSRVAFNTLQPIRKAVLSEVITMEGITMSVVLLEELIRLPASQD